MIPVYRNSANVPELLTALTTLSGEIPDLEVVFVVDGSPDDSRLQLAAALPRLGFSTQLLSLSRNFGTFAAIRAGLTAARGDFYAVMAADLQEPPELIVELYRALRAGEHDLAVGRRTARHDPFLNRFFAAIYWRLYRRFVQPEIPEGGVDIFGCNRLVRDHLLALEERSSSLVGLLFWVGFRRATVPYVRRKRTAGKSAWTFRKRLGYLADSVFSFSDLPIRLLFRLGVLGIVVSLSFGLVVLAMRISGSISVPGYAATVLTVVFFGGLNSLGLGIIGGYVWRAFENSKGRPAYIVASHEVFGAAFEPTPVAEQGCGTIGGGRPSQAL